LRSPIAEKLALERHRFSPRMYRRPYRGPGSAGPLPDGEPCTRDTPKCNYVGRWTGRPKCCTDHLLEIAVFIDRLLTRRGIVHWLDWGSLLGAVREGALIPWDGDIDFGVISEDLRVIPDLRAEIEEGGFHLIHQRRKRLKIVYSEINHLGVDLYRHVRENGSLVYRSKDLGKRPGAVNWEAFPESFVEEMETVHLYSHPFPAPSPVERFLVDHRYGATWMIPFRPIKGLFNPEIAPDQSSPAVEHLFSQLAESQQRLLAAKARLRPTRSRFRARHIDPGLPAVPLQRFVDRVIEPIPADQRTELVYELGRNIAALDQATAELADPDLELWLRRTVRTSANLATGLRRSVRPLVGAFRGNGRRPAPGRR
jgi:LicD family